MGASVSGHSSHPEHSARFKRVDGGNRSKSLCRMCQLSVEVGAAAYRCSEPDCDVVLHEACYRRPMTLKRHFGHHPKHSLTLGGDTRSGLSCSICGKGLGTPPVAYSCTSSRCAGFHAHPRCCDLPRDFTVPPELHEHTNLVLCPPSGGNTSGGGERPRRRRCLNRRKQHATTTTGPAAPWSYHCPKCDDVEYCLSCVLGNDDDRAVRCCCFQCCDVDPEAVRCLGYLAGVFFCGFLSGMGCPSIPTQPYPGDMELPRAQDAGERAR